MPDELLVNTRYRDHASQLRIHAKPVTGFMASTNVTLAAPIGTVSKRSNNSLEEGIFL